MSVQASIQGLREQFDATGKLTDDQTAWLLRTAEIQNKVVVSGEKLITHQQVSLLQKDLEIFDLKGVPLS